MNSFEVVDNIENAQNALKSLKTVINKVKNDWFAQREPDIEKLKNEYETISEFVNIGLDYIANVGECLNNAESLITLERSGTGDGKRIDRTV